VETQCCSSLKESELPTLKWCTAPGEAVEFSEEDVRGDKLRQYAYAGLLAASAVLVSKLTLKFLYGK